MARRDGRAIPMIAFPRVRTINIIIIIILVTLAQVCVVYVVNEVASFRGGSVNQ